MRKTPFWSSKHLLFEVLSHFCSQDSLKKIRNNFSLSKVYLQEICPISFLFLSFFFSSRTFNFFLLLFFLKLSTSLALSSKITRNKNKNPRCKFQRPALSSLSFSFDYPIRKRKKNMQVKECKNTFYFFTTFFISSFL